ncbi:MAG: CPBP family intramembrane metalloprotease [Lachnospiraceae bacterium]|nr:CPBP family intramembrane metalloprotease [Lachnospiraceae bacterium]
MEKSNKSKEIVGIIVAFLGAMLGCFGVRAFNVYVLMSLPLGVRMACMITFYWFVGLIPLIVMLVQKDKLKDYGFRREKMGLQIFVGVGLGLAMSLVLTLIPHLAGAGAYVDNGHRYMYLWQFIYEFVYCIVGVALTEEFVFRGILYEKIKRLGKGDLVPVICSSALFGLFHIFNGNLLQVVLTGIIGAIFCIFRLKIKSCSTLSLVLAHGVYDAMITVWLFVFLR